MYVFKVSCTVTVLPSASHAHTASALNVYMLTCYICKLSENTCPHTRTHTLATAPHTLHCAPRQAYEELLSLQRQNDNLKAANADAAEAAELASGDQQK